jgi:glycosyltransferase involved in cell wall biosynthesis
MNKKRILFIATEYAAGMLPFASAIINALHRNERLDVFAILISKKNYTYKNLIDSEIAHNTTFIEYPSSKFHSVIFKFYPYSVIKTIKQLVNEKQIDIVHYLTGEYTLSLYTRFIKNKYNIYYTVHDLYPHEIYKKSFIKSLIYKYILWGNKSNLKNIKNITTSSIKQFEILKQKYPEKKVVFTHFPSLITQTIKTGYNCPTEIKEISNYILFFGSVDKYKGVDLLIKAYEKLDEKNKFPLVIAGKGIQYIENKNTKGIIRINRFIADSEIKILFEKAICVVYPYRSATMSGVLSLAYYFRKRILVSSIPFFLENIDINTLTFEPLNIDDLSTKLERILKIEIKNRKDKSFYNKNYSEKIMINDYLKLYSINNEV